MAYYKNPVGRPLKFKSVKLLELAIDNYFTKCDEEGRPYTISGLALALNTDRATLIRYENNEEFYNTIKKAKLKIQQQMEERSITGKFNPTFAIFSMKNNFGWQDKQEQDINVQGEVNNPMANLTTEELRKLLEK